MREGSGEGPGCWDPLLVHQAQLFRQWSPTYGVPTWTPHGSPSGDELEELDARGIALVAGEVVEVVVREGRLEGLRLADGSVVRIDALAVAPRMVARSEVLGSLGIEASDLVQQGHVVGSHVAADPTGLTPTPGVWAAGNVADLRAQVMTAAADGIKVAAAINADLIQEEIVEAVQRQRALVS